jgi:hypothetical protein
MSALVYQAINAVAGELSELGIAKRHRNEAGDYQYRSIDDVLSALSPLLARHKLCVLPRVLDRDVALANGGSAQLVSVRAAFDLVSALDGSSHTIESFGEAIDEGDKGTAKAISAAYKSAMLQAFCIPVPQDDADASRPRLNGIALPEPPAGWESWVGEVVDITRSCDTAEAIDRLTTSRRQMLAALQRSRPDLYASVGEAIAGRLAAFQRPKEAQSTNQSRKVSRPKLKGRSGAKTTAAQAA